MVVVVVVVVVVVSMARGRAVLSCVRWSLAVTLPLAVSLHVTVLVTLSSS